MGKVTFVLDRILFEEHLTVPDLVRLSGVNRNTLYGMKNNTISRVDLSVLERICDALDRPLSCLIEYQPSDQSMVRFSATHRKNRDGLIFVISGPSGAGKNTLISHLKPNMEALYYIPSFTTRQMRHGETQGDPYYFVDLASFQAMVARGEFLEYEQIHGNYYGTHAKTYEYAIAHGYDAIKDIDVNGALNFKSRFGHHVVLIYVRPSSLDDLTSRLAGRGDSEQDIELRLKRIEFEESKRQLFDYVVYNDDVSLAKQQLLQIIESRQASRSAH